MAKLKKVKKEPEVVELDEMNIILTVPKCAAMLRIEAKYFNEKGRSVTVSKILNNTEVLECRQKFLDNLGDDDYDARYVITDKGREWLDRLHAGDPEALREADELFACLEDGE